MINDTIWSQMKQTTAVGESMAAIDSEVDFIDIGMNSSLWRSKIN